MIPVHQGRNAVEWISNQQSLGVDPGDTELARSVSDIIQLVRQDGDAALRKLAERFNDRPPRRLTLQSDEVQAACASLTDEQKATLDFAAQGISDFAKAVMAAVSPVTVQYDEYQAGLQLAPVRRAACYVPAGRYPLPSTALMTALTARAAGVQHVAIFSPRLCDEIIYAGSLAAVDEFYEIGGAQAIAAAAFGTQTIEPFDIVVGPGNAYVAEAKRQLQGRIGIDMLAGPSEIAIIADGKANPNWICLDLLSQAEHDPDARSYLLTSSAELATEVVQTLPAVMKQVKLPGFIDQALSASAILVFDDDADCLKAADAIAPEHLLLHCEQPEAWKSRLHNYGALFMGYNSTVPFGDYCAGPNHTLPTNRAARFAGGLNPLTFLRAQSWLHVLHPPRELATMTARFAQIEGLQAHAAASNARLDRIAERA